MGIPGGVRYEASAIDLVEVRDSCDACRADRRASVLVLARGEGGAPLFLFRGQAQAEAAARAVDAIPEVARVLAMVARCPSCGEADPETARAPRNPPAPRWGWRGLPIAFSLMVAEALLLTFVWGFGLPTAALFAVAGLNLGAVIVVATRRAIRADHAAADRRVEWTRVRPNGSKKWQKLR